MGIATDAIHAGCDPVPGHGAIMTPIHATSTYVQTVQEGTQTQYTLGAGDVDRFLRVVVEFTDDLGGVEAPVTNVIGPVTAAP